jgi:acetyltransferase-like isoleucine patch superfamily enzyme
MQKIGGNYLVFYLKIMKIFRLYGFFGCLRLIKAFLITKFFFREARLIRLPFDIRNKKNIFLGKNLTTGFGCRIEAHPLKKRNHICISFGDNVEINDYVHIAAGEKVEIGNNVLIASKVFITDINHGNYRGYNQDKPTSRPNDRTLSTNPVLIKDNVWIGESVCILPGVIIGEGCIIGALSVVTKNIPAFSIAVGSPAKVVKVYNFNQEKWVSYSTK